MDALRADSGEKIVLVTPAFPETGRTVYQGNLFVGAVPLNESPLKDHPLNPMHDSNLVRVLARQSRTKVGLVDLATVTRGPEAVRARLAALSADGVGAAIIDAVFDLDLETIGIVALDHRVSVGASGIGLGLARALVASRAARAPAARRRTSRLADRRPALPAVVRRPPSARSPAPKRSCRCCISIPTASSPGRTRCGARWPGPKTFSPRPSQQGSPRQGPAVDCLQRDAGSGRSPPGAPWPRRRGTSDRAGDGRHRRGPGAGGRPAAGGGRRRNLRRGGRPLTDSRLPGGEEIAAGVPVLQAVGAKTGPMLLALKSGNFGGPEFFSDALRLMR